MTAANPAPAHHRDNAARPDGNATDVRYLEETAATLLPIMAACDAAASRSARGDVRALARRALAVQTRQLAAISQVLRDWGRADAVRPRTTDADALVGLRGGVLDEALFERLTAHAHASTAMARAEMVGGASSSARLIAERAIHAQDRQLAALAPLVRTTARSADVDEV